MYLQQSNVYNLLSGCCEVCGECVNACSALLSLAAGSRWVGSHASGIHPTLYELSVEDRPQFDTTHRVAKPPAPVGISTTSK
jgi:hypothetical protein